MHLARMEKGNNNEAIRKDLAELGIKLGENPKLQENKLGK